MLKGKSRIPHSIYRIQPYIYILSGVLTLVYLSNIYGLVSGLLFISAGVLVIIWRNGKTKKSRKRKSAPTGRDRVKHTASMRYPTDTDGADNKKRAATMSPDVEDFPMTESPWGGSEPSNSAPAAIDDIADGHPVTASLLFRFSPFSELNESFKECVPRGLVVSRKPPGSVLIDRGSKDDLSIYLIEGTLILEAADGKEIRVVGGTSRALFPLCQLKPHIYSAIAATEVAVIMLSQSMLRDVTRIIARNKNMPGIQVSQVLDT